MPASAQELFRDFLLQITSASINLCLAPVTLLMALTSLVLRSKIQNRYKNVVVTGASNGIGEQIALGCAKNGVVNLLLFGRNQQRLEDVARRCREGGVRQVTAVVVDLKSAEGTSELVKQMQEFDDSVEGGIDCVVAAAATTKQNAHGSIETRDVYNREFHDKLYNVNVLSLLSACTAVLDRMKTRGRGHLVLMASINGFIAPAHQIVYTSTKAAILSYARDLHVLLKPSGIDVTVVCPGFIQHTGITEVILTKEDAILPRPVCGTPDAMAACIWKGILRKDFMVSYPFSHLLATFVAYSLPPSYWPFYSWATLRSKLFGTKLT